MNRFISAADTTGVIRGGADGRLLEAASAICPA
jgi:hypothetical protein